jgi:LmbE family N-acetylglucosaminyl deacetylase
MVMTLLVVESCATGESPEQALSCPSPESSVAVSAPPELSCDNEALTAFDGLLVLAPHPDDEVLAFAGLIKAYLNLGKPVEIVVTTDGDAYCDACRFWKSTSVRGPTCSAEDLSNFATPAVDSFAEVRHGESSAAVSILGASPPTFLGYPDKGLAAAWSNAQAGDLSKRLRRSDFSHCSDCETCIGGSGEGPETDLTAASLMETLSARISATSENSLVATSHWLDGHGDHAALGSFVKTLNGELQVPRTVAYGVIHANTAKDTPYPDCWYPLPQALSCSCAVEECATEDPTWIAALRKHRFRPDWPAGLPDDVAYGEETQLCLAEEMYRGETALKLTAVTSYKSQLGFAARTGEVPDHLEGIVDCNGYLTSFVRSTEAFVLVAPAAAAS